MKRYVNVPIDLKALRERRPAPVVILRDYSGVVLIPCRPYLSVKEIT